MFEEEPFEQVLEQLRQGEEAGANEVYHRFAQRLYALASKKLDTSLRGKVHAEDVVQSAFRSFFSLFRKPEKDQRFDVRNWDGLWALLVVVAVRKCRRQYRRYRAAARDTRRERSASAAADSGPTWEAVDREPRPDEAAALAELVALMLQKLGARDRVVLELRLRGHAIEEIGRLARRSERSVFRILAQARRQLRELLAEAGKPE